MQIYTKFMKYALWKCCHLVFFLIGAKISRVIGINLEGYREKFPQLKKKSATFVFSIENFVLLCTRTYVKRVQRRTDN